MKCAVACVCTTCCELVRLFHASSSRSAGIRIGGFHYAPSKASPAVGRAIARRFETPRFGLTALSICPATNRCSSTSPCASWMPIRCLAVRSFPVPAGHRGREFRGITMYAAIRIPEPIIHCLREDHISPGLLVEPEPDRLPGPVSEALRKTASFSQPKHFSYIARGGGVFRANQRPRLLDGYEPQRSYVEARPRAEPFGCTEAPRDSPSLLRTRRPRTCTYEDRVPAAQ